MLHSSVHARTSAARPLVVVLLLAGCGRAVHGELNCPDGWRGRAMDSIWCYRLEAEEVTYAEALQRCDVASFHSHEELYAAGSIFNSVLDSETQEGFWIGLTHSAAEAKWMWRDPSVVFETGLDGLPDLLVDGVRKCAYYDHRTGSVVPAACTDERPVVCRASRMDLGETTLARINRIDTAALKGAASRYIAEGADFERRLKNRPVRGVGFALTLPGAVAEAHEAAVAVDDGEAGAQPPRRPMTVRTEWGGVTRLYAEDTLPAVVPRGGLPTDGAGVQGEDLPTHVDILELGFLTVRVHDYAFTRERRGTYVKGAYGFPRMEIVWNLTPEIGVGSGGDRTSINSGGDGSSTITAVLDVLDFARPHHYYIQSRGGEVEVYVDGERLFSQRCDTSAGGAGAGGEAPSCPDLYPLRSALFTPPRVSPGNLRITDLVLLSSDSPLASSQVLPFLSARLLFDMDIGPQTIPQCHKRVTAPLEHWLSGNAGQVQTGPPEEEDTPAFISMRSYTLPFCMRACVQRDWCGGVAWDYQANCLLLVYKAYRAGLFGGIHAYPDAAVLNSRDGLPEIFASPTLDHFTMGCYGRALRDDPLAEAPVVDIAYVATETLETRGYRAVGETVLRTRPGEPRDETPLCAAFALRGMTFTECVATRAFRYRSSTRCELIDTPEVAGLSAIRRCARSTPRALVASGCTPYTPTASWVPAYDCDPSMWWVQLSLDVPTNPDVVRIHSVRNHAVVDYSVYACAQDPYTAALTCIPVSSCTTLAAEEHRYADCHLNTTIYTYRVVVTGIRPINATSTGAAGVPALLPVITDIEADGSVTEAEREVVLDIFELTAETSMAARVLGTIVGILLTGLFTTGLGAHAKRARKLMKQDVREEAGPVIPSGDRGGSVMQPDLRPTTAGAGAGALPGAAPPSVMGPRGGRQRGHPPPSLTTEGARDARRQSQPQPQPQRSGSVVFGPHAHPASNGRRGSDAHARSTLSHPRVAAASDVDIEPGRDSQQQAPPPQPTAPPAPADLNAGDDADGPPPATAPGPVEAAAPEASAPEV